MTELILLGLGTWAVWEWILLLLPVRVPSYIQPLAVGGLAFGLHSLPDERAVLCLAATAVVALLHQLVSARQPGIPTRRYRRI